MKRNPSPRFIALLLASVLCSCSGDFIHENPQSFCNDEFIAEELERESDFGKLYPISDDEVWGFINAEGNVVIEPQFKEVSHFSEGLAAFKSVWDGRWGFIDIKGEIVIEPAFNLASPFYQGQAVVTINGLQGIIQPDGKFIFDPIYQQVITVNNDRALIQEERVWYLVDADGDKVSSNTAYRVSSFQEGLAKFIGLNYDASIKGYLNINGEVEIILDDEFFIDFEALGFSNGRATIYKLRPTSPAHILVPKTREERVYGLIDKSGESVIPIKYDFILLNSNCTATVELGDRYGIIDLDGNFIVPREYSYIGRFSEGLAIAQRSPGEKYGYIDTSGKFIIEPMQNINISKHLESNPKDTPLLTSFPTGRDFKDGRALFQNENGKYGYIDKTGKIVIEPVFDSAFPFRNGLAKFETRDNQWGYVNTSGAIVWQSE